MATTIHEAQRGAAAEGVADPHRGCEPSEPQLLQLRSDRRLGHEWDDWDGQPLPNGGVFCERSIVFLWLMAAYFAGAGFAGVALVWLAAPRLAAWWAPLPELLAAVLIVLLGAALVWVALIGASYLLGRNLLPRYLAEGGLLPLVLPVAERVGRRFGLSRDRVGNSALRLYNRLAAARAPGGMAPRELLVLLPRCLGKEGMQGALDVGARYGVPIFVAARGRYAREMIVRQRPRAVVAVACERDLVSGVHDVAGRLPVLGTTLALPDGPCKNATVDLASLESQIRTLLGFDGRAPEGPLRGP